MKEALITGITGQDGSYLAELLLLKGYGVHGLIRRSSTTNTSRIDRFKADLHIHNGDVSDSDQISEIIRKVRPNEVYHLAAQSHVGMSFEMPEYTSNITALGTTRILEAIRKINPETKFYQASSSEMFGDAHPPQNETTPFQPVSPYACSKLYAYWMTKNYRSAYKLFSINGILFNHESPRRGEVFVTRKITKMIAEIIAGKRLTLPLGNLLAYRDWGYAPEYVMAMWKMMQLKYPDDYVIGTGVTHSVGEFLNEAMDYAKLDPAICVKQAEEMFRPTDVRVLRAAPSLARVAFGWEPKVRMPELVRIMVDADMREAGLSPIGEGDALVRKHFPNRWWGKD